MSNYSVLSLKVCSEQELCETCIKASTLNEKCYWCPIVNKCSHGFDIHRPIWMLKNCYIKVSFEKLVAFC